MKKCKHDETTVEDLFRVITTDRLERVQRMLRWLMVGKELDYLSRDLEHNDDSDEYRKPILDEMCKLSEELSVISDILKTEQK